MSQKPFGKNQKYPSSSRCFSQQIWYLPACKNVTNKAIEIQGIFHENIFQAIENEAIKGFNSAKIFCKKCSIGDLVLAIEQQQIVAIGVVMSEPLYDGTLGLCCSVEWQMLSSAVAVTFKLSPSPTARILNGGLAILAQCFTK